MGLDPHVQRIVDMLNAAGAGSLARSSLEERREGLRKLMQLSGGRVEGIATVDKLARGSESAMRLRIYSPSGISESASSALVFFHGGGFVAGSLETHDTLCRHLARESTCRVVSVEYRLAPEHPFPAAFLDGCAAAMWVASHAAEFGIDPQRIAVGGDSAGALLATSVCRELQGRGIQFVAQLLLCPITDFAQESVSRRDLSQGYVVDRATIERDLELYLPPAHDRRDPRVSPLHAADLCHMPTTFIHTAQFDPMRDEGIAYGRRLTEQGVTVSHTCHPGMIHLFYAMTGLVPYARKAMRDIGVQMRSALNSEAVS